MFPGFLFFHVWKFARKKSSVANSLAFKHAEGELSGYRRADHVLHHVIHMHTYQHIYIRVSRTRRGGDPARGRMELLADATAAPIYNIHLLGSTLCVQVWECI